MSRYVTLCHAMSRAHHIDTSVFGAHDTACDTQSIPRVTPHVTPHVTPYVTPSRYPMSPPLPPELFTPTLPPINLNCHTQISACDIAVLISFPKQVGAY